MMLLLLFLPRKKLFERWFLRHEQQRRTSCKRLSVRFLVRMDDVTARINAKLNNIMSADERNAIIAAEYKAIQKENSENGKYTVVVRDF
jgi:hypothetical protein